MSGKERTSRSLNTSPGGSTSASEDCGTCAISDGSSLGLVGGGTVLATACCSIPAVLALIGFGGLGFATFVVEYRLWFAVPAVLALGAGWGLYLKKRLLDGVPWTHGWLTGVVLTGLTVVSLAYLRWVI